MYHKKILKEYFAFLLYVECKNIYILINKSILYAIYRYPWKGDTRIFNRSKFLIRRQKKNRINVVYATSLEDYDRGKSFGNIGGCSCSFRYYRFLSMRRQATTTTRIYPCNCVQPCKGPPQRATGRMEHLPVVRGPFSKHHHLAPYYIGDHGICTISVADIDWTMVQVLLFCTF